MSWQNASANVLCVGDGTTRHDVLGQQKQGVEAKSFTRRVGLTYCRARAEMKMGTVPTPVSVLISIVGLSATRIHYVAVGKNKKTPNTSNRPFPMEPGKRKTPANGDDLSAPSPAVPGPVDPPSVRPKKKPRGARGIADGHSHTHKCSPAPVQHTDARDGLGAIVANTVA